MALCGRTGRIVSAPVWIPSLTGMISWVECYLDLSFTTLGAGQQLSRLLLLLLLLAALLGSLEGIGGGIVDVLSRGSGAMGARPGGRKSRHEKLTRPNGTRWKTQNREAGSESCN